MNSRIFGLIIIGTVGMIGMVFGFQYSNNIMVIGAFCLGVVGYAIWLFSDSEDLTLTNRSES